MAHLTIAAGENQAEEFSQEFTGERVIPGAVEPDLWNEHISRYQYASLFCAGKRVLDVGCGTGYGTALLGAKAAEAVGFDISEEAVDYAIQNYGSQARYLRGAAGLFPASNHSFDVVTAFEVIEHIENWSGLVREAERVLREGGVFLVSTPNKIYYAESRLQVGPNPFHVHEFEAGEFEAALREVFPYVTMVAQNRQEAFVFAREGDNGEGAAHVPGGPVLAEAQFFVAICSRTPVEAPVFVHAVDAGNLLREREQYIDALKGQVEDSQRQHLQLLEEHDKLNRELRAQNEWARSMERDLAEARDKLAAEQKNTAEVAAAYQHELEEVHRDVESKTRWALDLDRELTAKSDDLLKTLQLLDETHASESEKTNWALRLEQELNAKSEDLLKVLGMLEESGRELEARRQLTQELEEAAKRLSGQVADYERAMAVLEDRLMDKEQDSNKRATLSEQVHDYERQNGRLQENLRASKIATLGLQEHSKIAGELADRLIAEREAIKSSKWLKLGRALGFGPDLNNNPL